MSDTHHQSVWDAPEIGMSYHDGEGRQFLVFSLTSDYIYVEYGGGEIQALCRAEWPRLEPRRLRISSWSLPTAAYAMA